MFESYSAQIMRRVKRRFLLKYQRARRQKRGARRKCGRALARPARRLRRML